MSSTVPIDLRRYVAALRAALAAIAVALAVMAATVVSPTSAVASEAQQPEPQPPASETTVVVPRTTVPALEERVTESQAATTRLNRAVIGLILLAIVISGVTVFFWVRTRPGRDGGRSRRSGATIVTLDGTEQPVLDQSVGEFFAAGSDRGGDR